MTRIGAAVVALVFLPSCGQPVTTAPSMETPFAVADALNVRSGPGTLKQRFVVYNSTNGKFLEGATVRVTISSGESFTGTTDTTGSVILPVGKKDDTVRVSASLTGFCGFDDAVGVDGHWTFVGLQPGC